MAKLSPVSQKELIRRFRNLGFEGPYEGGKHPIMVRGQVRASIPNPHGADIGPDLLTRVLRHAGISREEWESAS
jgi:predicted RNA binding protein YcfA (HicA-like mRNA interferase family)